MKNQKKTKNKVKTFIKSQTMVSLILALLVLFLIIFNSRIIHNEKVYVIEGSNKTTMLKTGPLTMNNRIIFFNSPTIKYNGDDITLTKYTVGFYVNNKKIYEIKNNDTKTKFSLKSVLENNTFNFMDSRKNSNIYTKSVINDIEKMKFKLVGLDENGKKVAISIPLSVSEV